MKNKLLTVAFIMGSMTFLACNSSDDSSTVVENPLKKFEGNWEGTYTGTSQGGTWRAHIDDKGKTEGTLISGSQTFQLSGQLTENGTMNAEYYTGVTTVGIMTGTMSEASGSGTWTSELLQIEGTWQGNKNQ